MRPFFVCALVARSTPALRLLYAYSMPTLCPLYDRSTTALRPLVARTGRPPLGPRMGCPPLEPRTGRPPLGPLGIPNLIFKTETEIMKDSNRLTRLKIRLSG